MSSSSSKQTVGYWYRYLQHFGLCEGPVDALLEFRAGDRTAWRGLATHSQRIHVNKPKLWGGEEKEGGLRGDFDLMMGEADQAANDYLTTQLGPDQPTHRGKASIVWRGGRWGAMNPYPKPPAFKLRRVLAGWENDEPWYPEKAEIVMIDPAPFALYFALDGSTSMNETTPNGQSRVTNMKTAVTGALQAIGDTLLPLGLGLDIMIVFWGGNSGDYMARQSITRRGVNATTLGELIAWVNGRTPMYGTYFPSAVADAASFFAGSPADYTPISLFVTDGYPTIPTSPPGDGTAAATDAGQTLLSIDGLRAYGFNIDAEETEQTAKLDNSGNEVPVVAGGDPSALTNAILEALGGLIAMNPIHILYDTLTSSKMRGEPVGMIPDAWWRAAADVCHAEGFGLCTTYEGGPVRDFQRRICDVIAASVTQSRADGLYYVDLIRGDYDVEALPIIGPDDIQELVIEPSVVTELTNEIIVRWRDPQTRQDRTTAPVQSLGAIQCAGRVYSDTRDYPEIPTESLALRVAARDCQADSTPKSRLLLTLNRRRFDLRPGRRFRLQSPEDGIADMVCLIADGDNGTLLDGRIQFRAIQDVFGMPTTAYVQPESGLSVPGDGRPVAAQHQRVIEAPYVELVTTLSRADLDYLPADAGFILTMAARPASGLNYGIATAGVGEPFETRSAGEWCPTALIVEAAGHLDTDFTLSAGSDLDDVEPGTWALWDDEIVRVDALDADIGTVTLGRGCADTVPATHDAGSRIWFCGDWVGSDAREYAGVETVRAKLLTRTTSAELSLSAAPQLQIDMDSRQARPYPPARLQLNGEDYPAERITTDVVASWLHRDRVLQSDQLIDQTVGSIGPEPGTTYDLEIRNDDTDDVVYAESGISGDEHEIDSSSLAFRNRLALWSVRDGVRSRVPQLRIFEYGFEILGYVVGACNNETYALTITAPDAVEPVAWSISAGSLPSGLTLSSSTTDSVTISGVPAASVGYYPITVRAEDDRGVIVTRDIEIAVGNIVTLCPCDGTNGSTTLTDRTGRSWTRSGNAQITTSTVKFGSGAALFDGNGDFWTASSHADFQLGSGGDWSISFWCRPAVLTGANQWRGIISKRAVNYFSGYEWAFFLQQNNGGYRFETTATGNGSDGVRTANLGPAPAFEWHFITACKRGPDVYVGRSGVVTKHANWSPIFAGTSGVRIGVLGGGDTDGNSSFNGRLDEIKFVRGAALYTENFTPPSAPSDYPVVP